MEFAGGAANVLLAAMLERELGERASGSNLYLKLSREAAPHLGRAKDVIRALQNARRPSLEDARGFAREAVRGTLGKFDVCLPEDLLLEVWGRRVLDVEGAREALRSEL